MNSLRRRMLLATALGSAAVLLVAGVALYAMFKASLFATFDRALMDKAVTLSQMIELDGRQIELEFSEAEMAEFERDERPEYFQVMREEGTIIQRSPSLGVLVLQRPEIVADEPVVEAATLPDGRPGRIATVRVRVRSEQPGIPEADLPVLLLSLGRDTLDMGQMLARLRNALIAVGAAAIAVTVLLLAWLVRLGLKPVGNVADRISRIDAHQLADRFDESSAPVEFRPVIARLNELLARLEDAFAREKAMTANVAHELRSPVAALRTAMEVTLSQERDGDAYRKTMTDCLKISAEMQALIGNLLTLARLDAGTESMAHKPTDVSSLLRDAWSHHDVFANERRLRVDQSIEGEITTQTDPARLMQVFNNILENAVTYSDEGGRLSIDCHRRNGCILIEVANTGSGISPADAGRVFDRFWRGDPSRARTGHHSGLGLAICKSTVHQLNGQITAAADRDGLFKVTIELPA